MANATLALRGRSVRDRIGDLPRPEQGLLAACTASLVAWSVVMTIFMLRTPAGDYAVYRGLAPAAFDERALYDVRLGPLAFTYPAFAAAPLSLLATVGFGVGLFLLTVASLAALGRTIVVLARAVTRERSLPVSALTLVLVFLAVAVWFMPVTKTLLNGQLNLILLWLVVEDVLGDVPPRWRGVLTGVATGLKLTPGLFVVTMLLTGRRAWALRASLTFAATVAVGFVLEPRGSWEYWRHLGGGDGFGTPAGYGNQSLLYALVRVVEGAEYQRFLPVAAVLVVLALYVAVRLHRQGRELATWGVTAIAMLAVTPVSWAHHWVWMLLPLAALVATLPTSGRDRSGRVLLVVAVVVLWAAVTSLASRLDLHGVGRVLVGEWLGNAYLLVGLALLAWFALLAFRPRSPSAADLSVASGPLDPETADNSKGTGAR